MIATVIRVGTHQGENYIEVEHRPDGEHASPIRYAVPAPDGVITGDSVNIEVTIVSVAEESPTPPEESTKPPGNQPSKENYHDPGQNAPDLSEV
jgi:hypothetical protein